MSEGGPVEEADEEASPREAVELRLLLGGTNATEEDSGSARLGLCAFRFGSTDETPGSPGTAELVLIKQGKQNRRLLVRTVIARPADGRGASSEALWRAFRERTANSPFPGLRTPCDRAEAVRRHGPKEIGRVLSRADHIVDGVLTLLGRRITLEGPVDLHREPVSNRRVPLLHWTRIDHLDPELVGACKVLWEVNRHQHSLALGQAYALTGEAR